MFSCSIYIHQRIYIYNKVIIHSQQRVYYNSLSQCHTFKINSGDLRYIYRLLVSNVCCTYIIMFKGSLKISRKLMIVSILKSRLNNWSKSNMTLKTKVIIYLCKLIQYNLRYMTYCWYKYSMDDSWFCLTSSLCLLSQLMFVRRTVYLHVISLCLYCKIKMKGYKC